MQIEKNTVVSLHYRLQKDNAEGDLIEATHGSEPLIFLYGVGAMIPEFERQLMGKKEGDSLSFGIAAADAYGHSDPEAIVELPKETFVVNGKLAEDLLQIGHTIPMSDQEGNQLLGTVREIRLNTVVMDFNHPMAGQDLFFTVDVESVRTATADELEHGHVHGPGGHHH